MLDTPLNTNGRGNGHVLSPSRDDVQAVVDAIVERASRPLDHAQALPPAAYTSPALYELEVEKIWRKSWLYVGRVEEIPNPGDWIQFDVAAEPVLITRGQDQEIRALSRVCPHRFMDVLAQEEGRQGHSDSFLCPYHSWAFSLDGQLAGAPLMQESRLFDEEKHTYCLKEYGVEEWKGFIFINLDTEATPIGKTLAEIEPVLGNYSLEEWRKVTRVAWGETEVNWKLALDNGREGYHHQGLHKHSLEPLWPAHMVEMEPTETRDYFIARMFVSPEAAIGQEDGHYINPVLLPAAPGLTPYERSHYLVIGIYPGFILIPGPDMTLVQTFTPTGPLTHDMNFDILFHESAMENPDFEMAREEAHKWLSEIQSEDSAGLVSLQKTILATRMDLPGGALSHLERPMWSIQRYLANRLTGAEV